MDLYVSKHLAAGERVVHITHPHWIIFAEGVVWFLFGFVIGSGSFIFGNLGGAEWYLGAFFLLIGSFRLIQGLLYFLGTELGVTDKRIIGKVGIITRTTVEIDHNRVESVSIDQSILGRILDYGTVTIRGTGGTPTPVHTVNHPVAFRDARMRVMDARSTYPR